MIGLTIDKLSSMTKEDAAALRAIADVYHPLKVSQSVVVNGTKGVADVTGTLGTLTTGAAPQQAHSITVNHDGTVRRTADLGEQFLASAQKTADRLGVTATAKLHPDDNPAAGAPDQHALADQVFSGGAVAIPTSEIVAPFSGATPADPAAVFSGGAAAIQPFTVGVVSDQPDGVAVFAPNVQSGTPTPPPLPLVTPQTLPQQSAAATNVSPPPPPPPAPAQDNASAGVATTSPAQVELDSAGLPWDSRIHASTKTKTAKNVWTRRRGVEDSLVAEVEAQLRAAMAVPVPAAAPDAAAGAWPFPTDSSSVTGVAPAPTFPSLMAFITERIGANRLTQAQVTAAVQAVGLESLNLVMARVDLVPAIMDELRKVAP